MSRGFPVIAIHVPSATVCAAIPFLLMNSGYGAYLRNPIILLIVVVSAICFGVVISTLLRKTWGQKSHLGDRIQRFGFWGKIWCPLYLCLSFWAGWFIGSQIREFHCWDICKACDPIIEALEEYQDRNGEYPQKLSMLPDFEALEYATNAKIREEHFQPPLIGIENITDADVVFFLTETDYVCVVPIEKNIPLSYTRFSVFLRRSQDEWQRVVLLSEIAVRNRMKIP